MPDPEVKKFENDMKNRFTKTFKSLIMEEKPTRKEIFLPYAQSFLPIPIMNRRGLNNFLSIQQSTRVTK